MKQSILKKFRVLFAVILVFVFLVGCGKKESKSKVPDVSQSQEPDKVLYESAMKDLKKNRSEIARLTLQTLIETYPDSEYLAKAVLAIADSYYKEGGTAGLTQAVTEYDRFITLFPFLDEAAYAQMQIGMAYFRRMEKPDRDRTQARLAEQEFQKFLMKFPEHKLAADATQRLREVQEVLAEGDFRIGLFYYRKGTPNSQKAAIFRLSEMVDRYPLYSQADRALWLLGDMLARNEQTQHIAARYYGRIVQDYPLSSYMPDAKEKLTKLGAVIPQPNPEALARMQQEKELGKQKAGLTRRALGMFKTGPDVTTAAKSGSPNLEPPSEVMGGESLRAGLGMTVVPGQASGGSSGVAGVATPTTPAAPTANADVNVENTSGTRDSNPPNTAATKPVDPKQAKKLADKQKKEEEKKRKEEEKKQKESSSKKKKGLGKLVPW